MKKKITAIAVTLTASLAMGYVFVLSLLLGFLASRFIAGRSTGEKGKLKSIMVPLGKWRIHLHHWLYSLILIGLSAASGLYFISPSITCGLLGGSVFQGIYCYHDWYILTANDTVDSVIPDTSEKQ